MAERRWKLLTIMMIFTITFMTGCTNNATEELEVAEAKVEELRQKNEELEEEIVEREEELTILLGKNGEIAEIVPYNTAKEAHIDPFWFRDESESYELNVICRAKKMPQIKEVTVVDEDGLQILSAEQINVQWRLAVFSLPIKGSAMISIKYQNNEEEEEIYFGILKSQNGFHKISEYFGIPN